MCVVSHFNKNVSFQGGREIVRNVYFAISTFQSLYSSLRIGSAILFCPLSSRLCYAKMVYARLNFRIYVHFKVVTKMESKNISKHHRNDVWWCFNSSHLFLPQCTSCNMFLNPYNFRIFLAFFKSFWSRICLSLISFVVRRVLTMFCLNKVKDIYFSFDSH